jgi:hypothetical protein
MISAHLLAKVSAKGSALNDWSTLVVLLSAYGAAVVALFAFGRGRPLVRIPNALERLTRMPAWAAAAMATALFGVFTAGQGFYSDVAWHIALGRDKNLFTPPHTAIVVGLGFIALSGVLGIFFATLQRADVGFRIGALRIPWSTLPLLALGGAAVSGFPLDEMWHAQYGIDVTMWSPTHMLMILGASFVGLGAWLVLAEAGVLPRHSPWARGSHVVAAFLTLLGLAAAQGEFTFGVPQFQQLYHPVLVMIAGGFAFVAMRLVLGPWWGIGIALANVGLFSARISEGGGPVITRTGGIYIASAVAVELAARLVGTERRLRFALTAGAGVSTIGFAGEYAWNVGARQPWNGSLFPEVIVLAVLAAVGSAVVATAFASAVAQEPRGLLSSRAAVLGGLAVIAALVIPFPRGGGDGTTAAIHLERTRGDNALVHVQLDPPNAAHDAHWFQASTWQGGDLVLAEMRDEGGGRYVSSKALPVYGPGKTLVRLHRGSRMIAVPVHLPADPEIGAAEVPAVDRTTPFLREGRYLMREAHGGAAWFAVVIYVLLAMVAGLWIAAFVLAASRVPRRGSTPAPPSVEREHALVA